MRIRFGTRRTSGFMTGFALAGLLVTAAVTAVPAASATQAGHAAPAAAEEPERIEAEFFPDPGGEGRTVQVPADGRGQDRQGARGMAPLSAAEAALDGATGELAVTGPTEDRLDIVIVGDGYTAAQQSDFHADAAAKWSDITAVEPYRSYQGLFNVWTVDAVSNESGITGDPTADQVRDTALGSYFWCEDIERLICADIDKVASYAAKAPAAELVVVVSNSTKYGGAGYSGLTDEGYPFDGVSTLSSDHASSSLIAAHEIGHSVGLLDDEYTYESYGTWTGREPAGINSTTYTPAQLVAKRAKWYRWLGTADPAGGTVGTYEGSSYYPYGIFRPTGTSIMRELSSTEFNLPGREAMIAGFYRAGNALSSTLATDSVIRSAQLITVEPARLGTLAAPELRWYVDGVERAWARGRTTVTPASLGLPKGGRGHRVTAILSDRTDAVRDPAVRELATDRLSWTVAPGARRS